MSRVRKAALVVYATIVCSLVLGGIVLLSRSEFMPYHAEVVGMAWQAVPINTRVLFLAMLHTVGALFLSFGCALAAMLAVPFRRGEPWVDWTIPVVLIIWQAAELQLTLQLAAKTGAHTPWPFFVAGLCMTLAGAVLCALARHRSHGRMVQKPNQAV